MALKVRIIATDSLSGTLLGVSKSVLRLGTRFIKLGILAGTVLAGIGLKLAKELDKGLREIGTLMGGLTDKEMKNMGKELMNIASLSGQAMSSLTKAKYDIVSAGFNDAASSAIVLQKASVIAVGGVTDMATAADLLTTALNAYSLSAGHSTDVSDILFTTVRLGKTTMTELGGSMGRLLAISGQMDISLVEVGAALATLTAGGQNTAEATTAIRASIVQLMQPQTKLAKLIKDTEYETTLGLLASEGYAGALRFITEEAKKADIPMTDLFNNVRAMQAVLPLTGIAAVKFAENLDEFADRAGSAQGAYDEMQKSFQVTTARMKQNVNNMLISLGNELITKLQPKIDKFNKTMETMGILDWKKLANILVNNWSNILFGLGRIVMAGGKFIGTALIDSMVEGIDEKIPKLNTTLALVMAGMVAMMSNMGMPEVVMQGLYKVIERISDLELTGKKASTAFEDFKKTLSEIGAEILSMFAPAFVKVNEIIDGTTQRLTNLSGGDLGELILFKNIKINPLLFESFDLLDKKWNDWIEKNKKKKFINPDTTGVEEVKTKFQAFYDWLTIASEEGAQTNIEKVAQMTAAVGDLYGNLVALRKQQIQNELDAQIRSVLASGASEEEKQAKISNLREKARQKEIASLKKLKAIKLAMAISDTAVAIVGALGSRPFSPFNLVLASIVAAAGAAQIATIAASPYAQGGFARGGNIPASDTIPAMLSPNEIVSTSAASERFGAEIQRLNQIADGGGFGGGSGGNYYINAMDAQSFLEAIKRQPDKFAEAMQLVKSERYL